MGGAGICRYTVQIPPGELAASQGTEGYAAHALLSEHIGQAVLYGAVEHTVVGLVDEHMGSHLSQNFYCGFCLFRAVVGDAHIKGLAAPHDVVERLHGLLNGGL